MYAFARRSHLFNVNLFRWCARASAAVLVLTWVAFVVAEALRARFATPSIHTLYQAMALVIVFAGYAVGWRRELVGGVIAILGTLAFFAVHVTTLGTLPASAAVWFAAPGLLYLLAWYGEKMSRSAGVRQS